MNERESIPPKQIPQFQSEDEEANFWLEHDFTDYYDPSKWMKVRFPNLKPSAQSATTYLPELHSSNNFANKLDTLIKQHRTYCRRGRANLWRKAHRLQCRPVWSQLC